MSNRYGSFFLCVLCVIVIAFCPVCALAAEDTDGDGLEDRLEAAFHSDPAKSDSDGDGYADGREVAFGYSPVSSSTVRLVKEIVIVLSKQELQQKLGSVTIATHSVSTGKPGMSTPVGTFTVLAKQPRAWSRAAKLWMPWWMAFTKKGHGIHELPEWPGGKKEGVEHLGKPVSHGCVRLGIGAAKIVYDWAPIGTTIRIIR